MLVHIGPVPSDSARMWIAYARTVLAGSIAGGGERIPEGVVLAFEDHLNAWEDAAQGTTMTWSGEVDPDQLRSLALAFLHIADDLAAQAERRGYPISPPEGEAFYQSLVAAVVTALEHHEEGHALLSDQLRTTWPGLSDTADQDTADQEDERP